MLTVRPTCPVCQLDFAAHDAGDGPAVFGIFILGALFMAMALWVEFRFTPALWVHAVLWPSLLLPLTVALIRPAKAALMAIQFRHRHREFMGG
jgi:uncharacterized protein (DUF983 family)